MTRETQNMRPLCLVTLLALFSSAGCAYHNPVEPGAAPIDLSVPFQVTLGALPGSGAQAGTATMTARVQNANGAALANVAVTFTTSLGTIAPALVATGVDGRATAMLAATDTADVTATVGKLSAHPLVVVQPPTPPAPTPTPAPEPVPIPTPARPVAFLNVSASATTGVPLTFGVSSSATGVTWIWSFGDGATVQTTAFGTAHTYAAAGTYTATVSSAATSSASATITVTDPPAPTPTPAAALAVALTCTPGTHVTTATFCNVSLTYGGVALPGSAIASVDWDWGDGTTADNSGTGPIKSHLYTNVSTYTVFATVAANTVDGVKTAVTSTRFVVSP